jgi:hypothetical protein
MFLQVASQEQLVGAVEQLVPARCAPSPARSTPARASCLRSSASNPTTRTAMAHRPRRRSRTLVTRLRVGRGQRSRPPGTWTARPRPAPADRHSWVTRRSPSARSTAVVLRARPRARELASAGAGRADRAHLRRDRANSSIGLAAARELVGRGAHVVLAVRDTAKGELAAARFEGAWVDERRRARLVRPRPDRRLRCEAARAPRRPLDRGLQRRRHGRAVAAQRAGLRAADGHQPPRSRRAAEQRAPVVRHVGGGGHEPAGRPGC